MSEIVAFLAVVLAAVIAALLGLTIVRRTVPHDRLARHTDIAGYIYAVIGVIYAVILAQVVIAAWEEYRTLAQSPAMKPTRYSIWLGWPRFGRKTTGSTLRLR